MPSRPPVNVTRVSCVARGIQALEGQRDGLEHLMRIVKKDKQDLEASREKVVYSLVGLCYSADFRRVLLSS